MLVPIIEFLDHFYMIRDRRGRALGEVTATRSAGLRECRRRRAAGPGGAPVPGERPSRGSTGSAGVRARSGSAASPSRATPPGEPGGNPGADLCSCSELKGRKKQTFTCTCMADDLGVMDMAPFPVAYGSVCWR